LVGRLCRAPDTDFFTRPIFVQGAGIDARLLAATVCDLGLVPGEVTGQAPVGEAVPIGMGLACVVDDDPINRLTPLTSMFLHGSWGHLLRNSGCSARTSRTAWVASASSSST
jgi:hypothetical protein